MIADASYGSIKPSFSACVAAATQLKGHIDVLVCGKDVDAAAQDASTVSNVQKVVKADHAALEHHLAEPMAALICKVMERCALTHCILASDPKVSKLGRMVIRCLILTVWLQARICPLHHASEYDR